MRKSIFIFFIILFTSCKKEPIVIDLCQDINLGPIYLLPNAKTSIPYSEGTTLVFVDSMGNESHNKVSSLNYGSSDYNYGHYKKCNEDPSKDILIAAGGDHYNCLINGPGGKRLLHIGATALWDLVSEDSIQVYDELSLYLQDSFGYTVSDLRILVNARDLPAPKQSSYIKPIANIDLLGKNFQNVYVSRNQKLYYNYAQGVVGYRDASNKLWRLDYTY